MGIERKLTGCLLVSLILCNIMLPVVLAQVQEDDYSEGRKFASKPNDIKKQKMNPHLYGGVKEKQNVPAKKEGFQWGNILGMAVKVLFGGPADGANDKMDTITQLANGEFTWSKMFSLALQVILSVFGNDNAAIEKMDPGSPFPAILTSIVSYITGSTDPTEVKIMAKQASEVVTLIVSLLDALKTSFTQRSMEARYLGSYDPLADAAIAGTSMAKAVMKSYNTDQEICAQKYVCEANYDCARETSDTGYLFCQIGTYGVSYLLEQTTYAPFEIYIDAGRIGRTTSDTSCVDMYVECNEI